MGPAAPGILVWMLSAADILGLGHSISSFGQTLALLITFLGIGVIANLLIAYTVGQVLAERKQNQERMEKFRQSRVD
jgi:membrane protein implicated in regulation of membrane protease activity